MDNSSRKKILKGKKQRKTKTRINFLSRNKRQSADETPVLEESMHAEVTSAAEIASTAENASAVEEAPVHEESVLTEAASDSEDSSVSEETPAADESAITEDIPAIVENAVPDDVDRLLKQIKMEITFSDDSTIKKEIIISGDEWKAAKAPDETKMPWIAAAVLACIVCASFATGIFHWYNTYYNPADALEPGYVDANGGRNPGNTANEPSNGNANEVIEQGTEEPGQPDQPSGSRYGIEPLPEFLLLWEEYGNEDIVAVLTLAETEFLIVQSNDNAFYITHDINRNPSLHGWLFLDHEVDIYMGLENNMVLYDPVGAFLRQIIQEYADYDFFLRNPTILLSSLYGDYEWEIFSYSVLPTEFPFRTVNHPDDDEWGEAVAQFLGASLINTRLDVTMEDQVLTIAVPTTVDPELFHILQARMLRQITS